VFDEDESIRPVESRARALLGASRARRHRAPSPDVFDEPSWVRFSGPEGEPRGRDVLSVPLTDRPATDSDEPRR